MKIDKQDSCIAVVGIGCNYPGAKSPLELWENILARRQQFREMPELRLPSQDYYDPDPSAPDKTYQSKAAVLDGYEFKWQDKRIPKKTYESTDIVHWLALDTALQALEDAGYTKENIAREKTGVVLGNTLTGEFTRSNQMLLRWPYVKKALRVSLQQKGLMHLFSELESTMQAYYKSVFAPVTEDTLAGGLANTIAGRVCNYLDIHGGGYIVDGACSSSLLAICTAANHLQNGQMDMVIAGGVDISLDTFELIGFAKTGALTKDEMRVYDKDGKGFIPGEGCGVVILKRLQDARRDGDQIYAIINGWGISSDGKGGITAPSATGQAKALRRAYDKFNFDPAELDFIEGHGTGTTVGDRTELEGISLALNQDRPLAARSCGVTSFKSIVGHTKAAAGVGAFIKTVIALNQRVLPPTAGLKNRNPIFEDKAQVLYPILRGQVQDAASILQAGVSAMGFGGINSHILLQSADQPSEKLKPSLETRKLLVSNQSSEIFMLSADNKEELLQGLQNLASQAKGISYAELADYANHINHKLDFKKNYRAALVAKTPFELEQKIKSLQTELSGDQTLSFRSFENGTLAYGLKTSEPKVGALYPGQGSQRLNMAYKLVERFDWARELVAKATEIFKAAGAEGILEAIYRPLDRVADAAQEKDWKERLKQTEVAQPAIILASLLWQTYLEKIGLKFVAASGHSLGELMAFYSAGLYDLETLLQFAAFRGQAMARSASGTMASLLCTIEKAQEILARVVGYVTIANLNAPQQIVISGDSEAVLKAVQLAQSEGVTAQELPVSAAFHSKLIANTAGAIRQFAPLQTEAFSRQGFSLISSVTANKLESTHLNEYFAEQAINQVNFVAAARALSEECQVLIEVGPGQVLSGLTSSITNDQLKCYPVEANVEDESSFNILLGNLFVMGAELNVSEVYANRLLRPFVAASQKQFIVNPLERPFPEISSPEIPSAFSGAELPKGLLQELKDGNSNFDLDYYLAQRGEFLKDIILTDWKHLQTLKPLEDRSKVQMKPSVSVHNLTAHSTSQNPSLHISNQIASVPVDHPLLTKKIERIAVEEIEKTIYALVTERTGFQADQLEPGLRLLDDLNLDSIKAGSFLNEILKKYQLQGKIEAATHANASLGELVSVISEWVVREPAESLAELPSQSSAVREIVLSSVADKTGLPAEALQEEFRLLDDLNLDSIKAGSLLNQLAKQFQLQGKFQASSLANASLKEIIDRINELNGLHETEPAEPTLKEPIQDGAVPVVSSYSVQVVQEPLASNLPSSKTKNLGLVYTHSNEKVVRTLARIFAQWAENVYILDYNELKTDQGPTLDRLIVFVSETTYEVSVLAEAVQLFANVAAYSSAKELPLAFIQAGDGYFSRCNLSLNKEQTSILSALSFAASLHLERPGTTIRVIEFHPEIDSIVIAAKTYAEFETKENFSAVAYDSMGIRRKMVYSPAENKAQQRASLNLSPEDVVVVTGGAKGITAECALAFAKKYRCKLALVGSSTASDEVKDTLAKYAQEKLNAQYYSCDITDSGEVERLFSQISGELGTITGLIHGAGLNKPRRAETVSAEQAYQEISPKLLGALNIATVSRSLNLKFFLALTSIIGVTGMAGNSWYAFSNEALDLLLRNLAQERGLRTIALAYSVWSEVGMGERMGSTKVLSKMGIGAIPPTEGIEKFLYWFENEVDDQQVVVSAQLGGLDTWQVQNDPGSGPSRYLEKLITSEPGFKLVYETALRCDQDKYLQDHNFNGSFLFPTVFGLEAMVQAAMQLLGMQSVEALCFENISLQRPIVVPEHGELKIQIQASKTAQDGSKVSVAISTEESNFKTPHFAAEITFKDSAIFPHKEFQLPTEALSLEPQSDLYSWLLFQGPLFQNIDEVFELTADEVLLSTTELKDDTSHLCFSPEKAAPFSLGSPLLRDVLLQSAQLIFTQKVYLPVGIKKWEIDLRKVNNYGSRKFIRCERLQEEVDTGLANVSFFNEAGELLEFIESYELKALKPTPGHPSPSEIADHTIIPKRIEDKLKSLEAIYDFQAEFIVFKAGLSFNKLSKKERHQLEQEILSNYVVQNCQPAPSNLMTWSSDGKPSMVDSNLQISLSHSRNLLLLLLGKGRQGCDLEFIERRPAEEWFALLGKDKKSLVENLQLEGDSFDTAASRVWCAQEAIFKAYGANASSVYFEQRNGEVVVLTGRVGAQTQGLLTFPVQIWPGVTTMIAVCLPGSSPEAESAIPIQSEALAVNFDPSTGKFTHHFQTTFKDCKAFFGKTHFTNFPLWVGELRELVLSQISEQLLKDLGSGKFGMVTNTSKLTIYNEAEALDNLVGQIWITDKSDLANSFIDLDFEWFKKTPTGLLKIADSNLSTTWVKIEGHGIVKQSPIPSYFMDFLKAHLQRGRNSQSSYVTGHYPSFKDLGEVEYASVSKPRPTLLLDSKIYQTGLFEGNSVGNLYYSNYYDWQAKTADQLLYKLNPEVFRAQGKLGEFISLEAAVNHLQEAMPFEEIAIYMYLDRLYSCGFKLYFEYYSLGAKEKRKLAFGHNTFTWAKRTDSLSPLEVQKLPPSIKESLLAPLAKSPYVKLEI